MEDVKIIVSKNIVALRKNSGFTQLDLAERLNYSDKAVSRWEKGEVVPDLETIQKIANIFNVDLKYLIEEHVEIDFMKNRDQQVINKIAVSLLLVSVVWAIFTVAFVYLQIIKNINVWQLFVWAVPCTGIVSLLCNRKWGTRKVAIYLVSVFVWSLLAAFYLQFFAYNIWPIFIIGVPLQLGIVFASFIKPI